MLSLSQSFAQNTELISKAKELVYSNPDEALKITEHILKASQEPQSKAESNIIITECYLVKGDYAKAATHIFDDINLSDEINEKTKLLLNLLKARLLRKVYLDKQAEKFLNKSEQQLTNLPSEGTQKDSLKSLIALEKISMSLSRGNNKEAITQINSAEKKLKPFLNKNGAEKVNFYLAKEMAFRNLGTYDSSAVYLNKTFKQIDASQINNLCQKAIAYKELAQIYLQNKEFEKSEETLFIASQFAKVIDNPILLKNINKDLAIQYLAANQKIQHKTYNDKFLALASEVDLMEQETVNSLYNTLSNQRDSFFENEKATYKHYYYFVLAAIALVLLIAAYFILKAEGQKKRLKEIINYLEISRNIYTSPKKPKKSKAKRIAIPEETAEIILKKLKRFEGSKKFLSKDMSLAVLAGKFDTNTKYLSGVINEHYGDNFNTFINKLRINYIIEKLKTDPNYINYKISFLAEESGYSSHSSFATVFKSIVGMSPVTFIKLIQKERKGLKPEKAS